jgi:hypothetical protein
LPIRRAVAPPQLRNRYDDWGQERLLEKHHEYLEKKQLYQQLLAEQQGRTNTKQTKVTEKEQESQQETASEAPAQSEATSSSSEAPAQS